MVKTYPWNRRLAWVFFGVELFLTIITFSTSIALFVRSVSGYIDFYYDEQFWTLVQIGSLVVLCVNAVMLLTTVIVLFRLRSNKVNAKGTFWSYLVWETCLLAAAITLTVGIGGSGNAANVVCSSGSPGDSFWTTYVQPACSLIPLTYATGVFAWLQLFWTLAVVIISGMTRSRYKQAKKNAPAMVSLEPFIRDGQWFQYQAVPLVPNASQTDLETPMQTVPVEMLPPSFQAAHLEEGFPEDVKDIQVEETRLSKATLPPPQYEKHGQQ